MLHGRSQFFVYLPLAWLILACSPAEPPPPAGDLPTVDDAAVAAPPAEAPPGILTFGKSGPIDQAGFHAEFNVFRAELRRIVEARDTVALFGAIAPDIKLSFGGDTGLQGLRDRWRINDPATQFWTVLGDILLHGGHFTGDDSFTAPWTFSGLPDSLDAFSHLIVRAEDVEVRERPDMDSPVLGLLSYDIVRAGPYQQGSGWRGIALANGGVGYVQASKIRSPLDYRAIFALRNGRWWLVALVAGD